MAPVAGPTAVTMVMPGSDLVVDPGARNSEPELKLHIELMVGLETQRLW